MPSGCFVRRMIVSAVCCGLLSATAGTVLAAPVPVNKAAGQYLQLLENFAGWAEQHWNEKEQAYNAKGAGVTWARGNGDVCIVYAVLLTEMPDKPTFSPRQVPLEVMLDHVRRTLRSLCLRNKNCTDAERAKRPTWGGPSWQAALETEHWVMTARLLDGQLDDRLKALVRQVATAEAKAAMKKIPEGELGNTAADDCSWNAGLLGVMAAVYADDPQAPEWDEWAKRWALNTESRAPDRTSDRVIDGKPLRDWLVSTNAYPDLTVENHDFWNPPYQTCFAALIEPIIAHRVCGRKIPEAFSAHAREEGDGILKWLTLADGDLLCPQGFDWAERDVQHSWAFTELGTLLDMAWAREAERRCLSLLMRRQAAFGDGALHANDFGYETDLACCWTYSYLLHKYFGKPDAPAEFEEFAASKIFPYVKVGVYRTPDMVSSVTWFRTRQAVMVVPNNAKALGDDPSLTAFRATPDSGQNSGLGYLKLDDKRAFPVSKVEGEPILDQAGDGLTVSFNRVIPEVAVQQVGYCALPGGEVLVFSKWKAAKDLAVATLVDHPFYWVDIPGFLPTRVVKSVGENAWSIDGNLRMQVLGGVGGRVEKASVLGAVRAGPFTAQAGEILQDSVCVYQPEIPGREAAAVSGGVDRVTVGKWTVERAAAGRLSVRRTGATQQ